MNGVLIRLIIIKKVLVATVLLLFSVTASLSSMDMQRLARQTQLWADADRRILVRLAQQGLDLGPDVLRASAVVPGIYALLVYLAAWATWTERLWGDWLLVGLLVLPLPFEIRDLARSRISNGRGSTSSPTNSQSPQRRSVQVAQAARYTSRA